MNTYKNTGKRGLFDEQESIEKLSVIGNPLDRISNVVDFEAFRNSLEEALLNKEKKSNAGAKPFDVVELRSQTSSKAMLSSDLCLKY